MLQDTAFFQIMFLLINEPKYETKDQKESHKPPKLSLPLQLGFSFLFNILYCRYYGLVGYVFFFNTQF